MKGVVAILRSFFISPEFLVSVVGLALCVFCPSWFVWLSDRVGHQAELLKYAGLLPAGLAAYDLKVAKGVLLPDADKRTVLQGWPRYWEMKCGVVVGLLYGAIFAVAGIIALLFDWKSPATHQSALLITSVAGALTVSVTLFFAQLKVEELFRQHWTQKGAG